MKLALLMTMSHSREVRRMLACVYQPRSLQPPDPSTPAATPLVIDRVPGRARKMVASTTSPCVRVSKYRVSPSDNSAGSSASGMDKEPPRVTLVDTQRNDHPDKVGFVVV